MFASRQHASRAFAFDMLRITVGSFTFLARLEREAAPITCMRFESMLPFRSQVIHARWSGEAVWIPLGDLHVDVGVENSSSRPSPGEILLHPNGISETEILLPYGQVRFASVAGDLTGNHFLTIVEGNEQLATLGKQVLWSGAHDALFELVG